MIRLCPTCHGAGSVERACSMCHDSTWDHVCDDEIITCPTCEGAGIMKENAEEKSS